MPKPELYRKYIIKVIPRSYTNPVTEFYAVAESDLVEGSLAEPNSELMEVVPYDLRSDTDLVYTVAIMNLVPVNKNGCIPNLKQAVIKDERLAYYALSVMKARTLGKINESYVPGAGDPRIPFCQQTALHVVAKGRSRYLFESVLKRMDTSAILKKSKYKCKYVLVGNTVLCQIVKNQRSDLLRSLIKIKPELMRPLANIKGTSGYIPLHLAVINNDQYMINTLLPYTRPSSICKSHDGSDPEWEDEYTILDDALMRNNSKLVKVLIRDDYLLAGLVRRSPQLLHKAAKCPYHTFKIIFEAFITAGHSLTETQNGTTFFALMIQLRNSDCITKLMKHPSFDASLLTHSDGHGNTPLRWAAYEGLFKVCKRLYPTYASADLLLEKDKMGWTALAAACRNSRSGSNNPNVNYKATVDILLSNPTVGAELINTDDDAGLSPLALTIGSWGSLEVIRTLYDRMAPEQICRQYKKRKYTVLHLAVYRKGTEVIEILLSDKVKSKGLPSITDVDGKTALQVSDDPLFQIQHKRLTELFKTFY